MPDEPQSAARGLGRARRIGGGRAARAVTPSADQDQASEQPLGPSEPVPDPEAPLLEPEPLLPEPLVKKSRAGRNLPAAIGVAVVLGAVIIASLFLYRPSFAVIVGLAVAYGSYELTRAIATVGAHVALAPVAVGGIASLVAAWQRGPDGLMFGILLSVTAVLLWRIADGAEGFVRDTGASVFALLYLPALAGFAVLSTHEQDGAARILAFAVTVVCSDTGGYATGVMFGRHPLAPIVSKGKTWEGFAGSVVFCSAAGILFLTLTFHESWWKGLLFGLAICVTATLGDLGESVVKRDLGIKDMSHLLPGHGGLMDRLDSMLPCAAVGYLLLSLFAPV